LQGKKNPMTNDTVTAVKSASVGVHEQIESFLQTVMQGLMEKETQDGAAEQKGEPGRPVILPSMSLWMAVLVAVLRGLTSQRGIWRLLAQAWLVEATKLRHRRSSR
jgi:hypothetical protein